LKELAPLQMPQ